MEQSKSDKNFRIDKRMMSQNCRPPLFISGVLSAVNTLCKNPKPSPILNPKGKEITVPYGAIFQIHRPENKTTGFQWYATTSAGLIIMNDRYVFDCPPGLLGCGGEAIWTLKACERGPQLFSGIYRRSWDQTAGKTLNIKVNVI